MNQPFHFPDGRVANDAKELLELCQQYPDDATGFLVRQDLENWLAYIGNYEVAECATNARQAAVDDRQKLEEFISRYHSLTEPKPVPAAVPETDIKDNLTAPESAATITNIPEKSPEKPAVERPASSKSLADATPPKQTVQAAKSAVDSQPTDTEEKPSFFQVVAKLFVRIFNA